MLKRKKVNEIAKWFVKNDYDDPRNSLKGNMKLQKLLYFAQLVHLEQYDKTLFDEPIRAFEKGAVVDSVRRKYLNYPYEFIKEAKNSKTRFPMEVKNTLKLTAKLFGKFSADKLSELTHKHKCWKDAFEESEIISGQYDQEKNVISIEEMKKHALENIHQYIRAKKLTDQLEYKKVNINNTDFYYDPDKTTIDEELVDELKSFEGKENAYTIKKSKFGLVIY